MHMIGIWLTIVFLPPSYMYDPCSERCAWLSWSSWDSCSRSCGGGYRTRYRSICCRVENGNVISTLQCLEECNKDMSGMSSYSACNTNCYNRGTFHYDHLFDRSQRYDYGHCICSQKYGGTCCDIRMYSYR